MNTTHTASEGYKAFNAAMGEDPTEESDDQAAARILGGDEPPLPCPRFVRTELNDGASECLTIVQIEGRDGYAVQVTSGPEVGDDFVGLYDLDGDQLTSNYTWTIAETVPASVIDAVETGWANGGSTVERI